MAKAALEDRIEPTDPSFVLALRLIQSELIWTASMAQASCRPIRSACASNFSWRSSKSDGA